MRFICIDAKAVREQTKMRKKSTLPAKQSGDTTTPFECPKWHCEVQRASCLKLLLTSDWMRHHFHISSRLYLEPQRTPIVIVHCDKSYINEAFSQLSAYSIGMNAVAV
jgi:hypothetical protein